VNVTDDCPLCSGEGCSSCVTGTVIVGKAVCPDCGIK
jgi:transcription elongation factor Elf1